MYYKRLAIYFDRSAVVLVFIKVTVREKTMYKSKIAVLNNAHLKMQTLCYFMLNFLGERQGITPRLNSHYCLFAVRAGVLVPW